MTLLPFLHLACNAVGSVLLPSETDTADGFVERVWSGERYISIGDQCAFEIYETGRLQNQKPSVLLNACETCQLYELQTTPTFVECSDLGTLSVGGQKYRAVRPNDNGLDLWYISVPSSDNDNWGITFITTAQGDDSSWSYTFQNTLQDFVYTTQGQFSLEP